MSCDPGHGCWCSDLLHAVPVAADGHGMHLLRSPNEGRSTPDSCQHQSAAKRTQWWSSRFRGFLESIRHMYQERSTLLKTSTQPMTITNLHCRRQFGSSFGESPVIIEIVSYRKY
jgi:hypothetical protein